VYRATLGLPTTKRIARLAFSQHEGLRVGSSNRSSRCRADVQRRIPRWLRMSSRDDEPRSAIAALLEANRTCSAL